MNMVKDFSDYLVQFNKVLDEQVKKLTELENKHNIPDLLFQLLEIQKRKCTDAINISERLMSCLSVNTDVFLERYKEYIGLRAYNVSRQLLEMYPEELSYIGNFEAFVKKCGWQIRNIGSKSYYKLINAINKYYYDDRRLNMQGEELSLRNVQPEE